MLTYIPFKRLFNRLQEFLHWAQVDRAVFFGALEKISAILLGSVTALLVAAKFTPELQGYYFTFRSLLVLQVFVELGLGFVIIQFASHEWSKLSLDKSGYIVGDKDALSRLISLAKITLSWYLIGSTILIFGLGIGGYIFFLKSHDPNISWVLPWLMLCLLTGVATSLIPIWSLLEGCNQVANVYTYRFWQGLFSSLSIWLAILLGAKLWMLTIGNAVTLICAAIFFRYKYWNFLKTFLSLQPTTAHIRWRKDILPMQWRIAISWISGYFSFFIFIPVLFHYHGPVIAGQFGMTWYLVFTIGTISTVWLTPKVPQFGMLIAQRKYKELDSLFWRVTKVAQSIIVLLAVLFWLSIYLLNKFEFSLANRLLPPLPTGILLLAQVILYTSIPFSYYLRAHKREPLLYVSLIQGISVALSTLILGKYFSVMGMAIGYLLVNIILTPIAIVIWYRCRIEWHKDRYVEEAILDKEIRVNEVLTREEELGQNIK